MRTVLPFLFFIALVKPIPRQTPIWKIPVVPSQISIVTLSFYKIECVQVAVKGMPF